MRDEQILSVRDRIFGTVAGFSALFCFAVSFALKLPGGRKRFFIALAIFVISFSLVRQKKGVGLGILAFIALRFIWAAITLLMRH
jgi:hypothetical protein